MADLVVGMAKSVVDGALTKAQAAIEEEAKLRTTAQRNLVFITGEFQMMLSFLNVADGERLNNVVVRTWVRQIRDLAYDVEDCIEFVVHLDKRSRWWLRLLEPWRWLTPAGCLAPLELDEAVAELERLRARVEDVSTRNVRYNLINDSASMTATAQGQTMALPASGDAVSTTAFDRYMVPKGTKMVDLTNLFPKKESGDELRVISVWGSGGGDMGMTSVVWDAYIDIETCNSFPCRAWLKLRRPFNPDEFVRSLMAQFFANTCQEQEEAIIALDVLTNMKGKQQSDLLADLSRLVKKRFLLVLEDLCNMEEWNAITTFFPKGNKGSVIIVSTLHSEVARLSVGYPYRVVHIGHQLSAQHFVYAFCRIAKGDKIDAPVVSVLSKKEAATKWMDQHPLVGRESDIKDLCVHVQAAARSFQVVSVWGIAGVGKSALVKHVFCDRICNYKIHKNYAWVDLSHPFNLWDFARSLVSSFSSENVQTMVTAGDETMGTKNPIVECRETLRTREQKCFIVIDGVQSKKEWDLIQAELISGCNPKTVIIVVASEESIATYCRGPKGPYMYNVKCLEPEAAFRLFLKVSEQEPLPSDLKMLRELVSKCGGVPKIIVEIAATIAKRKMGWMVLAESINKTFMQKLENNAEFGGLHGLFSWMQSYYRSCPDFLKPCIFYVSIFTPDQTIRRRRLVRRWNAEGYCRDSHEESADDIGENYFFRLLNLSIFEQPSTQGLLGGTRGGLLQGEQTSTQGLGGTRMVSCKVNGFFLPLFRKHIISTQMEENLVFELDGNCVVTTQRTGRHLVISEKWDRDKIVFQSIDFSRLRSLTVSGKWESFLISESMKLLRVLDLEDALEIKYSDVKNIVKWFPRLKFLSLRGHSEICHLPSSVGDLRQLQTLDIRHTSIVTLPVNITKLKNLQYIRAGKAKADHKPSTPQGAGSNAPAENEPSTPQVPLAHQIESQRNISASKAQAAHKPSTSQGTDSNAPVEHEPSTSQVSLAQIENQQNIRAGKVQADHKPSTPQGPGSASNAPVEHGPSTSQVPLAQIENQQNIRAGKAQADHTPSASQGVGSNAPVEHEPSSSQIPVARIENQQNISASKTQADHKPSTPQCVGSNAPVEHGPSTSEIPLAQIENQQNISAGNAQADHKPSTPQGAGSTAPSDHKPSTAQLTWSRLSDYCRGRHLVGVEMPRGIGTLTALHTLGVVNIRASGTKAFLKDLEILTQLRKLGVSGINKSNCKKFFSALKVLVHLESLSVRLDKCSESCLEGIDQLPVKSLRSLKLHGLGDKLPTWSEQLTKVTKIDLEMAKILKDTDPVVTPEESATQGKSVEQLKIEKQGCMKFLGSLPELRILRIRAKQFEENKLNVRVVTNKTEVRSYQNLKILEIACSSENSQVTFGTRTMNKLEQLIVDFSDVSNCKFSDLDNLIELREISLQGSNHETLKKHLESQLEGHIKKPVVKKLDRSNWSSTC